MSDIVLALTGTLIIFAGVLSLRHWTDRAQMARKMAAELLIYAEGIEAMHFAWLTRRESVENSAGLRRG